MSATKSVGFSRQWIILIIIGMIALASILYLKTHTTEKETLQINLPQQESKTVIVDIAKGSFIGHYVKPKAVLMIADNKNGIVNAEQKPLMLKISLSGFLNSARMESANTEFDPATGTLDKPLLVQKSLALKIKVELPKSECNIRKIGDGYIHFVDQENGKEIGAIHVIIINSSILEDNASESTIKPSCCK